MQRSMSDLELKLRKAKLDLLFLLSCKKRNVIPKLWFKVANRNLKNSSTYRSCQRKFLDEEVAQKCSRVRSLSAQASTAYSTLSTLVSYAVALTTITASPNKQYLQDNKDVQKINTFLLA